MLLERRLAAILAADVVGYTRLMGADEAGTLERLTTLREQVLEPLIAEHHGRVVKLMGDGILVDSSGSNERPLLAESRPSRTARIDPNRPFKFAGANVRYQIAKRPSNGCDKIDRS